MTPSRLKRSIELFLLAVTFVSPALLTPVARPNQGPRTSPMLARRAVRRSRRFIPTSRTQVHRAKVEAADQPGVAAGTDYDFGRAVASGVTALTAASTEALIRAADVPAVRCSHVPLYLVFCTLLI